MAHQSPLNEMDDLPEEVALHWPQLAVDLKVINSLINPVFENADKRAIAHQRLHRRLVLIAALSGTAAVLLAILQLSALFRHNSESVVVLEAIAVVSALVAVSTGIVVAFSTNWLFEREKA